MSTTVTTRALPTVTPAPAPRLRWPGQSRRGWCLAGGLLAIASFVGLWQFSVVDPRGRLADQAAFLGADLGRARLEPVAHVVLDVVSARFLIVAMAVAVLVALMRRQWGDAARAVLVVVCANLTAQILKAVIERPRGADLAASGWENSLPSGHTTVAASVAAGALIVAPRSLRPLIALLGAGYAALTGIATISLGWHRPSDVLAAMAIVAAWTLLALALSAARTGARPGTPGRYLVGWLLGIGAVVGIAIGLVALSATLAVAGPVDSTAVVELSSAALRVAFVGSCAGVAGGAALFGWALLLARR